VSVAEQPTPGAVAAPSTPAGSELGWSRLASRLRALWWLLPVAVITPLVWPLLFGAHFGGDDWPTHVWYIWHQDETLRHGLLPSLFVHYEEGVFYPHFAFYGGTLYTLAGALSIVLGGAGRNAYIALWIASFAVSYGGWLWLGRLAGLGRWAAQAPAVLVVSAAYSITLVYSRGDFPEFVATSCMPLVAASSISVIRAKELRALPAVALAASTVVFTGSHNVTLLYGTVFLAVVLVALMVDRRPRQLVTRRGVLRWLGIVVPATLVNAWFLWPMLAYESRTRIGTTHGDAGVLMSLGAPLVAPEHVLALARSSATTPDREFDLTLPVLAIAWLLVTGAVVLWRRTGSAAWRRALVALTMVTVALTVVMMNVGVVKVLPAKLQVIQFTYRLESFVLMGIGAALIAVLVLVSRPSRGLWRLWTLVLVAILGASVVAGAGQAHRYPRGGLTSPYGAPWITTIGDFADVRIPELTPADLSRVTIPWNAIRHDRVTVTAPVGPGQYVDTNLMGIPALMHVEGATIVGSHLSKSRLITVPRRQLVLQIDPDATPGAAKITISAAKTVPVVGGRVLTLLGLLGLAANFVAIGAGRRRRLRGAR
jgi:hypothetical protein